MPDLWTGKKGGAADASAKPREAELRACSHHDSCRRLSTTTESGNCPSTSAKCTSWRALPFPSVTVSVTVRSRSPHIRERRGIDRRVREGEPHCTPRIPEVRRSPSSATSAVQSRAPLRLPLSLPPMGVRADQHHSAPRRVHHVVETPSHRVPWLFSARTEVRVRPHSRCTPHRLRLRARSWTSSPCSRLEAKLPSLR